MSSRKWEQRREENQRILKILFQNGRTQVSRLKTPSEDPDGRMKATPTWKQSLGNCKARPRRRKPERFSGKEQNALLQILRKLLSATEILYYGKYISWEAKVKMFSDTQASKNIKSRDSFKHSLCKKWDFSGELKTDLLPVVKTTRQFRKHKMLKWNFTCVAGQLVITH